MLREQGCCATSHVHITHDMSFPLLQNTKTLSPASDTERPKCPNAYHNKDSLFFAVAYATLGEQHQHTQLVHGCGH